MKKWIVIGWALLGLFFAFSVYAAWRSRHETLVNVSEIARVREIQVQRGERIEKIEERVSALEPAAHESWMQTEDRWTGGDGGTYSIISQRRSSQALHDFFCQQNDAFYEKVAANPERYTPRSGR